MADEDASPSVNINYLKASSFREVPCDGVLGGLTPQGKVWLSFYSERLAIPQVVRHKLVPGSEPDEFVLASGDAGLPIEGRTGVIRNMEVGVYMSRQTAEELYAWLGQQLNVEEKTK